MLIHVTQKLAEKLKITPETATAADPFYSWRANYAQDGGQRFVAFMNDETRFAVVVTDAKAAKLKKLDELFAETLRGALLELGVNPDVIDRYFAEAGEIAYARNADRAKTAQLNKTCEMVWYGLDRGFSDAELSKWTSQDLVNVTVKGAECFQPDEKMLEALARYGLPVRKCRAVTLTVTLELEGENAVRKLLVPADITFTRLHKALQAAFGWHDYHLYSFGMFKEWSENYYARPDVELGDISNSDPYETNLTDISGKRLSDYIGEYSRILYIYDFGDDWHHRIEVGEVVENCDKELPILLEGSGDAPPEDVGGQGGFANFLETIGNREDDEYEDMTTWAKSQRWRRFDFAETARTLKYKMQH